jgi:hypothetical protein
VAERFDEVLEPGVIIRALDRAIQQATDPKLRKRSSAISEKAAIQPSLYASMVRPRLKTRRASSPSDAASRTSLEHLADIGRPLQGVPAPARWQNPIRMVARTHDADGIEAAREPLDGRVLEAGGGRVCRSDDDEQLRCERVQRGPTSEPARAATVSAGEAALATNELRIRCARSSRHVDALEHKRHRNGTVRPSQSFIRSAVLGQVLWACPSQSLAALWGFACGRGAQEKTFAELKGEFALGVVTTKHYAANSEWQQFSILAHNLIRSYQLELAAR